jgi:hypothetical protein
MLHTNMQEAVPFQRERILTIFTDGESDHIGVQWQGIYEAHLVDNPSSYPLEAYALHKGDWVILMVWHLPGSVQEQVLRNLSTHYPRVYKTEQNAHRAMTKLAPPITQLPLALTTLKELLAHMDEGDRRQIRVAFEGIRGRINWQRGTIHEEHRFLFEWAQSQQEAKDTSLRNGSVLVGKREQGRSW